MATTTLVADPDEPEQRPQDGGLTVSAEQYERWGWLVLRAGSRLLLAANERVSAVELPAAIGAEVHHYLAVRLLAGPVVALPGVPRHWLMLTESADDAAPVSVVRLRARNALVHRSGTLVPLPPSRLESGAVTWHVPPSIDGPKLPPFSAVVGATRAVTEPAGLS
ncbi:MAG: hypothetical protein GEV28_16905 [Actinophytocola sp.]|uniref:hypothetical protein n=1 Tax=Actinophytocola sp. TaxID=1872138 RepID=UPI00132BB885|nr:hypothetical protein [Actinophytocola sp.]MPZ81972.1 hypothetical protein [Actinophytocola sp.]